MPDIRFYNTLTQQLETFVPLEPPAVKLYVCGPTVYDDPHLGHARCYITWDVLSRFLTFLDYQVGYTRNITDVDDKILKRAQENGESPEALAERYTEKFHHMMYKLNTVEPLYEPRATEYIPQMFEVIGKLLKDGYAYQTSGGTVYYDTSKKSDYGNLAHQDLDDLQSGARVDVDPEKKSPLDFALWKPAAKDAPSVWQAPWGWGRPGWHIECTAMSLSLLGEQLDIHCGGMDLIFPHHQNEIAQSEAFTGKKPFVRYWMHNGFVNVSGEKMSKSLGNFSTIESLLETYDANAIRYFILTQHYRSPMDFNDFALMGARNRVNKIVPNVEVLLHDAGRSVEDLVELAQTHLKHLFKNPDDAKADWEKTALAVLEAMADDMNTAQALAHLNDLLSYANTLTALPPKEHHVNAHHLAVLSATPLGCFLALSEMLGLDFNAPAPDALLEALAPALKKIIHEMEVTLDKSLGIETGLSSHKLIDAILKERVAVRESQNWALSDKIRDSLAEIGIYLKDRKDGPTLWHYDPPNKPKDPAPFVS